MLPRSIVLKCVQPIPRRYAQIGKQCCHISRFQLSKRAPSHIHRHSLRPSRPEELFSRVVGKCLDDTKVYCVTGHMPNQSQRR